MNLDNLFVIELVFVKENGNSIKYGFTTAEQVIGFLQGEIAAQQSVQRTGYQTAVIPCPHYGVNITIDSDMLIASR